MSPEKKSAFEGEYYWVCNTCGLEFPTSEAAVVHEKNDCEGPKDAARRKEEAGHRVFSDTKNRTIPLSSVPRSVWGIASWITKWDSQNKLELIGFPAYPKSILGIGNFIVSGWTGASKIQINNETNEIIELTEAFGYRRRRIINSDTYDSFEVRGSPNQYLMFLGFLTLWLYGLGLIFIIWSYFRKHWFLVMNFGFKSTTNERIACRIDADDFEKATEFCETFAAVRPKIDIDAVELK